MARAVQEKFQGKGGLNIAYRVWKPAGQPRAAVLIVPGFNSHSGRYEWPAQQLAGAGYTVYGVDLRGRGASDGERFYVDSIDDYVSDVDGLMDIVRQREAGLKVFVLGHSAGGVTSCVYTLDHQDRVDGLICESFAFQVPAPGVVISAMKGLSHL